jgi:hypothetical protein
MKYVVDASDLPSSVRSHLETGYMPRPGVWLVRPLDDGTQDAIVPMNQWLRGEEAPYPAALAAVTWFGDDGVGNILGWDTSQRHAVLWNPADEAPWRVGPVEDLWRFVLNGYKD